jgi:hypothetical protein
MQQLGSVWDPHLVLHELFHQSVGVLRCQDQQATEIRPGGQGGEVTHVCNSHVRYNITLHKSHLL